ncbi:tyrosine-type recombinase/integrase [Paenibacillus donghaensis]|uniref:Recombinase n=1 Tax=Paenibacillus donghaensis TaxID=414771 RepID=A0A2Z2KNI8_9BACL|nr:site-specific integrase [Paenibacillus donghaensis]ASA22762.1 recombinase [Paenibacillus donghaensis]
MAEFNKNMLRETAEKLPPVDEQKWQMVNEDYRNLVEEYISVQAHSQKTKIQYRSCLRQFGYYIYKSMNNKFLYDISKRDFLRYISFLRDTRKMSSSAIGLRKACVSSLCNYIENVVADDDKNYKMFRNFTRGLPAITKNSVYNKVKISKDDYDLIMKTMVNDKNYLGAAWVAFAFNVGARRAEIPQFKTEILNYPIVEGGGYTMSHIIRLKGRGEDGKQEPYMVNEEALQYAKLWIEKRDYEAEYIFTTKYSGETGSMSEAWANEFCKETLSNILGRRINPHLFKASCVTYLLEVKKIPIEIVSKYVAHHENIATTIAHYDLRDFAEERNKIFG